MTEIERIKEVLYQFENAGLILGDPDAVVACLADTVLGIGLGEQGIVRSKQDVWQVCAGTRKENTEVRHTVEYGRIEVSIHAAEFASACAEVIVVAQGADGQRRQESRFSQMLSLIKQQGQWKVCALHASTPMVSEETLEAYPLKIAEKTLESLRKKIGEQVYQAEEQYRRAILADTIAFYVLNLSDFTVEKCQLNGSLCAFIEQGTPLKRFIDENVERYVAPADIDKFTRTFSLEGINRAFREGAEALNCEYRLLLPDGGQLWVVSALRLITDAETGEHRGIMYVRDISKTRQEKTELLEKASRDSMTGLFNRAAMCSMVDSLTCGDGAARAALIMMDVDNFKCVNDTYGHPVGDEVLICISRAIETSFPLESVPGRIGGDEFCIFVPDGGGPQLDRALETLRSAIADIRLGSTPQLRVSCSMGVAVRRPGGCSFQSLYEKADKALYASKYTQKGGLTYYRETE